MKKLWLGCAVVAMLAVPATAAAKPSRADRIKAAQECRAERTAMGVENFREKYGKGRRNRHAFRRCVRRTLRADRAERRAARRNAAKECKAERQADPDAFREKYGTNRGRRNALGKCVSQKAKEKRAENDEADKQWRNAAKECKAEQKADPAAFREKYGTNRNKRNAFGKCVSEKVKEGGDDHGGKPNDGKPEDGDDHGGKPGGGESD